MQHQDFSQFDLNTEKEVKSCLRGALKLIKERFGSDYFLVYNYNVSFC